MPAPSVWNRIGSLVNRWTGWTAPTVNGVLPESMSALEAELRQLRELVKEYAIGDEGRLKLTPYTNNPTAEEQRIRTEYPKLLKEPVLKSAFFGKIFSVASLDLVIQPADRKNPRDREVAEFMQHCLTRRRGGVRHLVEAMSYGGLVHGFSVSEKVLDVEDRGRWTGKIILKELKPKNVDQSRIQLEVDEFNNLTAIAANYPNGGRRFDPAEFVVFTYLPVFGSRTGISDFRAVYRAVTLKEAVLKLRMIALDKFSGPYLVGKFSSPSTRAGLETALAQARAKGFITIPHDSDVQVIDLALSSPGEFKAAIDDLDKEIVIGLNGAYLHILTGSVPDARGDSVVQKGTTEINQWYLASVVSEVINTQIIPTFVDLNYGEKVDLPTCSLGGVNAADILAELAVGEKVQAMGAAISKDQLYHVSQWSPPEDESDALMPPSTAPIAPAGGGGFDPFQ